MKRSIVLGATLLLAALTFSGCKKEDPADAATSNSLVVYNWGEYIDPDVLDEFEEETGISIIYDEFETNEIMYPKVEAGAVVYDVIWSLRLYGAENDRKRPSGAVGLRQNPEYF